MQGIGCSGGWSPARPQLAGLLMLALAACAGSGDGEGPLLPPTGWGNGAVAGPRGTQGASATAPEQDASAPGARRHVVILSIDGCRPDAFAAAKARNLMKFAADSARATSAFTIPLSLTLPSHSSMLSGYDMERHGVDWNIPDPVRGYIKVPTIFQVAHAAGMRTIMIMGKGKFLTLQLPESLDEVHEVGGDEAGITDQAIFVVRKRNFDLLFIHFPNPDLTGHQFGWMSPEYLRRVSEVDVLFGRLVEALPGDATLIVTADHGGHDLGHGADVDVDRHIPWMIKGPGIRKKATVSRRIETMDTAATALRVLGLSLDPAAQGRVVEEVFAK
jgi:predicted AlkP superfamily pyrophosphatase or phosphodiesterase